MKPSTSRPYYYIIYKEEPKENKNPLDPDNSYLPDSKKSGGKRYGNSTKPIM